MLLPRDTSSPTNPADAAAAKAEETATRQAMFENGRIWVNSHE